MRSVRLGREVDPPSDDDLFSPPVEDDSSPSVEKDNTDTVDAKLDNQIDLLDSAKGEKKISSWLLAPASLTGVLVWQDGASQENQEAGEQEETEQEDQEETQEQESTDGETASTQEIEAAKTEPAPPRRVVQFSGGTTKLDVRQWPLAGDPEAKHIFVEMFDYTCPHCRSTYGAIRGAKATLGKDLSVVVLPVPLSSQCNPLITKNNPKHIESCQLSKLAVCVWRANPEQFEVFHDWMFENTDCPNYATALTKAIELVGQEALEVELNKTIAAKYIERNVQLYQRAGGGEVPKLLFPTTTVVGEFTSADGLTKLIQEQTGK